jgi:hypothetical protein
MKPSPKTKIKKPCQDSCKAAHRFAVSLGVCGSTQSVELTQTPASVVGCEERSAEAGRQGGRFLRWIASCFGATRKRCTRNDGRVLILKLRIAVR